jgi:hypothetical protein
MRVDPVVLAKAGAEFTLKASELACAVDTFTAAAHIPRSAIGSVGPGQPALTAYQDLLARVTEHLHHLQRAVAETGTNLIKSAANYEEMDRAVARRLQGW